MMEKSDVCLPPAATVDAVALRENRGQPGVLGRWAQ